MNKFESQDIVNMLAALAIYRIGLVDLQFRDDEKEDENLRNKTLEFVSLVLGPKIVSRVDQIEAELRARAESNNAE